MLYTGLNAIMIKHVVMQQWFTVNSMKQKNMQKHRKFVQLNGMIAKGSLVKEFIKNEINFANVKHKI